MREDARAATTPATDARGEDTVPAVSGQLAAIRDEWLPPTGNLESPADGCDLDYIPTSGRAARVEHVLTNSFGFGGINAALVFRRAG